MADFPLTQLRALLGQPTGNMRGVVVRTRAGLAYVATRAGLEVVTAAATLQPGQRVIVRNGTAWPAARAARRYVV